MCWTLSWCQAIDCPIRKVRPRTKVPATQGRAARVMGLPRPSHLVHDVNLSEHATAGDLDGDGADQEDSGVEPEDGRDGGGEPLVLEGVEGAIVTASLGDEEGSDDSGEEHKDGGEGEEEAVAVGGELLAGASALCVPVVAVASAAGALIVLVVGRTTA